MNKKLFSITCTTCRAKLAVRSESAIGTIVECPRCRSMVQVMPPPGWTPAAPPAQATSSGPPPLDHVAIVLPALELEQAETFPLGLFLRQTLLPWGIASMATLAVVCGLLWIAFAPSDSEQHVAIETGISSTASEPSITETKRPATANNITLQQKRPATAVAGEGADQPPVAPGSQSGGVAPEPTAAEPITEEPVPTPSIQPPLSSEEKTPQPDPFPPIPEQPQPVAIKKTPLAYVDVAARLTDPLSAIELTDLSLVKAIELPAAIGAFPVTLDAEAIRLFGITPRDPISLQLGSTTIGDALKAIAAQKGLAVVVENDQVIVTSPPEFRETLRTMRYSIDDLAENDAAVTELAGLIQKLVAPESWRSLGGRGAIEIDGGTLVVVQTGDVQRQVLIFCEKIRAARHKPLRSRENPEQFTLTTRVDQARTMLTRPVTANFYEPTPLGKILVFLSNAGECDILIDRASLAAAETSGRVEATLSAQNRPLSVVLDDLLRPLGLTYRVIDSNTIEVTTHEAADERLELEFYPVKSQLAKGVAGSFLAERLKARVASSTWTDIGGLAGIHFDSTSQCLIVLQSQPVQAVIERLLKSP